MAEPWTPTDKEVSVVYIQRGKVQKREGEWNRWLSEHDRKVQAEAWQRGWNDRAEYDGALLNHWWGDNPYTREDGGEDE